jgi:hypothetical protein
VLNLRARATGSTPCRIHAVVPEQAYPTRDGGHWEQSLRWRLIAVPGRLVRHARHLILRLPPGHSLLPEVLARLRELPVPA